MNKDKVIKKAIDKIKQYKNILEIAAKDNNARTMDKAKVWFEVRSIEKLIKELEEVNKE
jgi:hypothetical protein